MEQIEQTLSSLEVAEMVEKEHKDLMRDIRRYSKQLAESKIAPGDFFTESTYLDANNQSRPCFLVTKKGCEFIAHKLTGTKGTAFTARYINRFHDMEQVIKDSVQQTSQNTLTDEEIVDWKLNDLHKRLKALEKKPTENFVDLQLRYFNKRVKELEDKQADFDKRLEIFEGRQADKPHLRLTPRKNTWYEKNRNRIWRVRYDKNIELKELYHIILEECSKYYDLDEAEQMYSNDKGYKPRYSIDLVEQFPELQEIANQVLDYYEG